MKRVLYVVSEDWAFLSHRLHIAEKAVAKGYSVAVLTKVTKTVLKLRRLALRYLNGV